MSTQVKIGDRTFSCVKLSEANFKDIAAVYVILCVEKGGSWTVLDVGQSGEVGTRINSHDRQSCWESNCTNKNIWVCVYPMPSSQYSKDDRTQFESFLRKKYNPPCGER
ncbi:hypothetical protein C4544_03960 [candidate division WS5 bacterium]|uniref:GIY-YIG nuclease family protein n=1 Tax=candidate division WS5 bacterium TaxID=2093353 RepID=A0A419DD21_9BACT|nr:MAG: hypothetical protein C4544_03960 [candidate division WS5 bacterium]